MSAFDNATRLIEIESRSPSSIISNRGLAVAAASFLAIAESINNLADAIKEK